MSSATATPVSGANARCAVLTPRGVTVDERLRQTLHRPGLEVVMCPHVFAAARVLCEARAGQSRILLLVEPAGRADARDLVDVLERYVEEVSCWVFEANADPQLKLMTPAQLRELVGPKGGAAAGAGAKAVAPARKEGAGGGGVMDETWVSSWSQSWQSLQPQLRLVGEEEGPVAKAPAPPGAAPKGEEGPAAQGPAEEPKPNPMLSEEELSMLLDDDDDEH